ERSPMPELRLVVLAIQEKLGFGPTFGDALTQLFGEAARTELTTGATTGVAQTKPSPETPAKPAASPSAPESAQQLVIRAIQEFEEYQRLTAQGKLAEAGQKLEQHKRTLEDLRRVTSKP
ncbi:MAG TPA: hypothetical protein VFH31_18970, partial [Pyrinomonadaceae bacterium]|nr:hypothetical protein [Pyrinomonadaceae bacterium]